MSIAMTAPVTLEEFLRLAAEAPEGMTLELIDGEIVERPVTVRRPSHTRSSARITQVLLNWLDQQTDVVGKRLETYLASTLPLFNYYGAKGRLVMIDGERPVEAIFAQLSNLLS